MMRMVKRRPLSSVTARLSGSDDRIDRGVGDCVERSAGLVLAMDQERAPLEKIPDGEAEVAGVRLRPEPRRNRPI